MMMAAMMPEKSAISPHVTAFLVLVIPTLPKSPYKETNQYKYNQNADQHNLNPAACFRLAIVK